MSVIHVLDKEVAQLIAAGEVVERPSSVIKELVENSVDAGATLITVEIKNGGVTYMRVSDNGCGIAPEDVPKVFLRHATSKVRNQDDLGHIETLGFRGEAMASIHAVCEVEMMTKVQGALEGTRYTARGGDEIDISPAGCPNGTTMIARNIFFNTPARMKFLKKDVSEANSIAAVVEKTALAHPEISFKFIRDGQMRLHTPGDGKLLSAIHAVMGKQFTDGVIPVDYIEGQIRVSGYITKPSAVRSIRTMQNFFINGRYVKSRTMAAALEEAYKHSIMAGKFPGCILSLGLPSTETDVNVHPSKIEVRFTNEKPIFDVVYYGVKNSLAQFDPRPNLEHSSSEGNYTNLLALERKETVEQQRLPTSKEKKEKQPPSSQRMSSEEYRRLLETSSQKRYEPTSIPRKQAAQLVSSYNETEKIQKEPFKAEAESVGEEEPAISKGSELFLRDNEAGWFYHVSRKEQGREYTVDRSSIEKTDSVLETEVKEKRAAGIEKEETRQVQQNADRVLLEPSNGWESVRLIGELFATYIILEKEDNMILVDKHAAHERLIFNQLKNKKLNEDRQLLLEPIMVSLSREDYQGVLERMEVFIEIGFLVEDFGNGDLIVREVPVLLDTADIKEIIEQTAHNLTLQKNDLTPAVLDDLLHSVACKSAVRAGDKNKGLELWELVKLLREDQDARYCPHGRPIAKNISKKDLEKMFGRIQ